MTTLVKDEEATMEAGKLSHLRSPDGNIPRQKDGFVPLDEKVKHQSFLDPFYRLRPKMERSLSNGYPGVRAKDSEETTLQRTKMAFVQNVKDVRQGIREEVKEAQKGKDGDFLLEMTLTRTLSLLPTKKDITAVARQRPRLSLGEGVEWRGMQGRIRNLRLTADRLGPAVQVQVDRTATRGLESHVGATVVEQSLPCSGHAVGLQ